ncbi:hypothetical protein HOLleu_11651 [Holothuria leucospilota]|uniref:Uncharacterized protein n=1 Tax=Holothuria leucospilota TaxID=206669 RepID=A0A9Q1CF77_HOLLE|nr:hypothetical protein HOLleu_11651 [Holothuria leucospilota]
MPSLQQVISNKGKDHGGVKSTILHRTPLTEINGQKLAVHDGDQIKKSLIKTTKEFALTPGEKKGRRSLNLDYGKQSLGQPKCNDNREVAGNQHEAENIQEEQDTLSTGLSLSSLETVINTSEPGLSLTCDDFDSKTFNLISSSVEPIHCNSSSVISLTSINSEDFLEASQQHDESFLIAEFVSEVISKAQKIVSEESVSGSDEANQAEKGLYLFPDTERNGSDVSSAEEQQLQSQEINFTEVNIIEKENVGEAEDQSFPLSYLEESASREEDFLDLVSIRSSPALEEVLESSGEERLLAYEDSCLSQDLEGGVEDVSEISLQNFFQLQQEMPEVEDEMHTNLLLQLTPSKILSSAPQIVPVFQHAASAKSEYEVALCSGNLWHSKTRNEVITSPVRSHNIEGNRDDILTTPVQTNSGCFTSPLSLSNHSQMTSPVGVSEETSMTPPCLHVRSCNTSPVELTDQSTVMSPFEVKYQSCNTTPIEKLSKETETVHLSTRDTAVGEVVVTTNDFCTHMTPSKSLDKECGTSPLMVCNVSQMTTPVSSCERSTLMTPSKSHDKELSNFTRKSENSMALMDQMKSSYISNKLLRREVSSLKKHRTLWEEHLQKEQQEMRKRLSMIKHKETEIHHAKQAVKASVQNEIDDLLTQVGQQLTQIGELEQNVQQKDEEIENLKRTNEERKKKYCDEVKELQDDLCLAYKQHEIEVTELKDKLEKQTSYEKLYHKLMAKNRKLEEEALSFTELKESLMKATEIQKKMSVLSETFIAVKSLFQKTLAEKSALDVKQKELCEKEEELLKKFQKSSEETEHLIRETKRLQEVVEEEKKKSILVETERERLQDELCVDGNRHAKVAQEIETLRSDGEGLRGENTQLKDAELLLRASQQEREDILESEMSDVRDENVKMKEKLDEMDERNKRLTSELETMKTKYSEAVRTEDSLKVQLKNEQESKEFVQTELESMEEYAKELEAKVKTSQQDLDISKKSLQEAQNAMQNYELMNPTSQVQEETPTEGNSQSSSLVFSILNSPLPTRDRPEPCNRGNVLNLSSSVTSHTKDSISPVEHSSSQLQERNLIGQSAHSAFSRVHPASSSREEADLSLGEHVQKANDLFNVLTEKIFHKMQISNQKIAELEGRSDQLVADLQKSRKQYDSYVLQLQNQLQDSELQVRHLKQQLQAACSKTYDDQEKLHLALREAQAAELCTSQNNEQKLTIIRMQKEIEKLVKELKMAEYHKQVYQEQVTSLTNLISNKGSPDIKQTMALLSKVSADHTTLKKEMRIVQENWQKAEAEVQSLDSLFNHCVKLLEEVPPHVRNNDKNLQTLTRILLSP